MESRLEQDLQHAKLHIDACRRGIDENCIEGKGPDLKEKVDSMDDDVAGLENFGFKNGDNVEYPSIKREKKADLQQ